MSDYQHKTWHEKRAVESTGDPVSEYLEWLIQERDALRAENERLREALEEIVNRGEDYHRWIESLENDDQKITRLECGILHGKVFMATIAKHALEGGDE